MPVRKERPIVILIFSDTHPNSMAGLCHPDGYSYEGQEGGGSYSPGRVQKWLWKQWLKLIGFAADLKKYHKADLWAVSVGDGCDDNHHSKYGLITPNRAGIVDIAAATWEPVLEISDLRFVFRGTEAHTGGAGELEELLAEKIKATPDERTGAHSWWSRRISAYGVIGDYAHHAISYSRRYWTVPGGAARQAATMVFDYQRSGDLLPRYGFRGHGHHLEDTGETFPIRVVYCPPFQATTAFGHRTGYSGTVEGVGGFVMVCHPDGESDFYVKQYWAKREAAWSPYLMEALKKSHEKKS